MSQWILKPEIAYAPYHDFTYSIGALTASQQHQYHNEGYVTPASSLPYEDDSPEFSAYVYRYYQTSTYYDEQRRASCKENACWTPSHGERIAEIRTELGIAPLKKVNFDDDDWDTPLYDPDRTGSVAADRQRLDTDINHMSMPELDAFIESRKGYTSAWDKELVFRAKLRRSELISKKEARVKKRQSLFAWLSDGPLNREEMQVLHSLCQGFVDWWDSQEEQIEYQRYRKSLLDELHLLEGLNR